MNDGNNNRRELHRFERIEKAARDLIESHSPGITEYGKFWKSVTFCKFCERENRGHADNCEWAVLEQALKE